MAGAPTEDEIIQGFHSGCMDSHGWAFGDTARGDMKSGKAHSMEAGPYRREALPTFHRSWALLSGVYPIVRSIAASEAMSCNLWGTVAGGRAPLQAQIPQVHATYGTNMIKETQPFLSFSPPPSFFKIAHHSVSLFYWKELISTVCAN